MQWDGFLKTRGQSLVEVLFATGVLVLVLSGTVVLLLVMLSGRGKSVERKAGVEAVEKVAEMLTDKKKNEPGTFWQLANLSGGVSGYEGYNYTVEFNNIANNSYYPNCGVGITDCAEAVIKINWGVGESLVVTKFFGRK